MKGPFWTDRSASPIHSHHFAVEFGGVERFAVKAVTLPSMEISSNEYQVGNQVFKYPGVGKWNDITLTLVDTKETLQQVVEELENQGFKWGRRAIAGAGDVGVRKTDTGVDIGTRIFFIYQ